MGGGQARSGLSPSRSHRALCFGSSGVFRPVRGAVYHDQTGVFDAGRQTRTAQHGITKPAWFLRFPAAGPGCVDAKGVFEGDRIAGRVVKYVDPGKSTKGESSHQGHTR